MGASKDHKYKLPPLNAGVTPALISHVCSKLINVYPVIVPLGIEVKPHFNHLIVEDRDLGPSNCLTTGKSMPRERVVNLYKRGLEIGKSSKQPILISESVPGGTTTAQAVMEAFGLRVSNLVGSSLFKAPRELRRKVVQKGLLNANLKTDFDSFDVVAAVGDPFQAFSMGLLIGARLAKQPVILSGGSQMLAIILLVLEFLDIKLMEINKLIDLNNLRTAPQLSNSQEKKLLKELEANIFSADWITIGIMAPTDNKAIEALQSISKKYSSIKFGNLGSLQADGGVFLKANQKTSNVFVRSENGLGEGILITCQYEEGANEFNTFGPLPLDFFT